MKLISSAPYGLFVFTSRRDCRKFGLDYPEDLGLYKREGLGQNDYCLKVERGQSGHFYFGRKLFLCVANMDYLRLMCRCLTLRDIKRATAATVEEGWARLQAGLLLERMKGDSDRSEDEDDVV